MDADHGGAADALGLSAEALLDGTAGFGEARPGRCVFEGIEAGAQEGGPNFASEVVQEQLYRPVAASGDDRCRERGVG